MKRKNRFKIDTYKEGGNKSEWVSNKISEIMKEGKYPQDQAIAIAYSMYSNRMENGGTHATDPKRMNKQDLQNIQVYSEPSEYITSDLRPILRIQQGVWNPKLGEGYYLYHGKLPGDAGFNIDSNREFVTDKAFEQTVKPSPAYNRYITNKTQKFDNGGDYNLSPDQNWYKNNPPMFSTDFADKQKAIPYTTYNPPVQETPEQTEYTQPPQFLNPYGGYDTPTMTQMSGYYLGKGDYGKGAIASTGALLGTARNFFSGMGAGKVQEEGLKKYYEDQRSMNERYAYRRDGGYFQEGGVQSQVEEDNVSNPQRGMSQEQVMQQVVQALQQGADPNQIIQQLMQMGVPQDQAVQMVQGIMQQLQPQTQEEVQEQPMMKDGGYYLSQMKGKKIKDYRLNTETNSYDVEFE